VRWRRDWAWPTPTTTPHWWLEQEWTPRHSRGRTASQALHRVEYEVLAEAVSRDDRAVVGAPGGIALDPRGAGLLAG
jgi:hypothetical protein